MAETWRIALRNLAQRGRVTLREEQEAELRAKIAQDRPSTDYDQSGEGILERIDRLPRSVQVEAQLKDLPKSVADLLIFANMGKSGFGVEVGFESGWRARFPSRKDLSYLKERYRTFRLGDNIGSFLGIARLQIGVVGDPLDKAFITLGITDGAGKEMDALSRHSDTKERVRQLRGIASPFFVAYHRQLVSDLAGYLTSNHPHSS